MRQRSVALFQSFMAGMLAKGTIDEEHYVLAVDVFSHEAKKQADHLKAALQTRPGYEDGVRAAAAVAEGFIESGDEANMMGYIRGSHFTAKAIAAAILALLPAPLTEDQSNEG